MRKSQFSYENREKTKFYFPEVPKKNFGLGRVTANKLFYGWPNCSLSEEVIQTQISQVGPCSKARHGFISRVFNQTSWTVLGLDFNLVLAMSFWLKTLGWAVGLIRFVI